MYPNRVYDIIIAMKIRLKALLSILIIVLLYATYYWVVPIVVNIPSRIPAIKSIVKKQTGMDIRLENPTLKMGLTPSIWLGASSFAVVDKKSEPLIVSDPKIKIELLPLFLGKVHLAYFSCDKINTNIKIDKDFHFYIGDYLITKETNSMFSIEDSTMDIGSYKLNVKDESENKNIFINGEYFYLEKFNSKKHIKFSTNSKIKADHHFSTINADVEFKLPLKKVFETNEIIFDGKITNLDLGDFSRYIKKFSQNNIQQIDGILNIEADTKSINLMKTRVSTKMVVNDFTFIESHNISPINFKNKLNITTVCDFSKNTVDIKKFKVQSGTINLDVSGNIHKTNLKNPLLNLSVIIKKSRIEDFIALLPPTNSKDDYINIAALKKYGFYSDMQGKLLIKGKSSNPKITGKVLATNGYIIKPLPSYVPKTTIKLDFLGDKLLLDILVPVDKNQKVSVKGDLELYKTKKILFDITSTTGLDLQRTESILNPVHEIFNFEVGPLPVIKLEGLGNINLKINGTKTDSHLHGAFNFRNTTASFNGVKAYLKNGEGSLSFNDKDTLLSVRKADLDGKPVKIQGTCTLDGVLDYDITANNQDLEVLINILKNSPILSPIQKTLPAIKTAGGKLNITVKLKGKVKNLADFIFGKTVSLQGTVKLNGNNILFSNLPMPIKNLFGNITFKDANADFDLYSLVNKSKVSIKGNFKKGVLNSKIKLDNVAFLYSNIPVKIFSGHMEIHNNKIMLYKINAILDLMPVLIDGTINNIFENPDANIYINSKPTQRFIDKYINKSSTYPLKTKGDIIYSTRIHGTKDSFSTKTEINMQEDSSIYYMGSTLGDTNNPIRIYLDTNVTKTPTKHSIYVNNFQYDKLISSQNDKEFVSPQLNAKGEIDITANNDIKLHNFRVRTQNPTDAKIFNILFKKPLIKQGLFSSDVIINNSIASPYMLGDLNFNGIDIPLLDTTIKDISLNFGNKNIDIKSKGEVFGNKVTFFANMENRMIAPYVLSDVDIYFGNLDINQIAKSLNKLEIETDSHKTSDRKGPNITNLIIKNAKLKADSVLVKNVYAKNLTSDFSLNEKLIFSLDDFKFEVAEGTVNGDFQYNLLNSKSSMSLHVDKVNANSITDSLFDLPNQVFGSLTGQVDLTCNGKTHKTCMDTLSGSGGFRIADGKMPKLGSLEYLLKAANLVKGGVTGITLNSIIELVTPLKTGQFETINGSFTINSGLADSIQIFSKGKDLSIFLTGTYNFSTLIADMEVFGRVSKKIYNGLGVIGNTSLNTLFNTIPGLNLDESNKAEFVKNLNKIPGFELNDKTYRIFSSEIYGDINGDNYVKSFKWVE